MIRHLIAAALILLAASLSPLMLDIEGALASSNLMQDSALNTTEPDIVTVSRTPLEKGVQALQAQEAPLVATAVSLSEVQFFLQDAFCNDGLCSGVEGWVTWIILDDEMGWNVTDLVMVRTILLDTIAALNGSGFDGHAVLKGYRFRKVDEDYVSKGGTHRVIATVNHESLEITLSRSAFLRQQGFTIYHELGHIVDRRLDRQLTAMYVERSHHGSAANQDFVGDGYWVRRIGQTDKHEGAADAFAIWMTHRSAEGRNPIFPGTPVQTDYARIAQTVAATLAALSP